MQSDHKQTYRDITQAWLDRKWPKGDEKWVERDRKQVRIDVKLPQRDVKPAWLDTKRDDLYYSEETLGHKVKTVNPALEQLLSLCCRTDAASCRCRSTGGNVETFPKTKTLQFVKMLLWHFDFTQTRLLPQRLTSSRQTALDHLPLTSVANIYHIISSKHLAFTADI